MVQETHLLVPHATCFIGQHHTFVFEGCSLLMEKGPKTAEGHKKGFEGTQQDSALGVGRKVSQTVKHSTFTGDFTRRGMLSQ